MANPAKDAREKISQLWPGASVHSRHRNSIILKHPTQNRFIEACNIGPMHIENSEEEIDSGWVSADPILDAPWLRKMVQADYHAFFGPGAETFNSGQIVKYVHPGTGSEVSFQAQQLQWVNNLEQIQPIADPSSVSPSSIVDGRILWEGAFGAGLDFEWETETARLAKRLIISALSSIGSPSQTIINGGNPALRLQFIFQRSAGVEVWVDGVKWSEKLSEPISTSGRVEFRSGGQTLWYFDLAHCWGADGDEVIASQRFRRSGQSFFVEVRVPWSWLQSATFPVVVDPTVSPLVPASGDDGRWGTSFTNTTTNNTFGNDGNPSNAFQRFVVTGPANGDTINSGTPGTDGTYLRLVARLGDSTTAMATNINAALGDDPAAPTSLTECTDPTRTTAFVAWDFSTAWSTGNTYYTPDISTVIQEIIDQSTWASGEHILVYIEDDGSGSGSYRRPRSYDASTTDCPRLYIEYTVASGVSGTLAKTLDNFTSSSAGTVEVQGTLSKTLDSVTSSSAGTVEVQGTLSKTLDNVTSSSAGAVEVQGTLAKTLDDITVSSAGTVGSVPIEGTLAKTLDDITSSSSGTVEVQGTLAKTLDNVTSSSAGAVEVQGTLSKTLDAFTLSSTGVVGSTPITGDANILLDPVTASSAGTVEVQGTLSKTLDAFTLSSSGTVEVHGTSSVTLENISSSSAGSVSVTGSLSKTLDAFTLSSSGSILVLGASSVVLADITLVAVGTSVTYVIGDIASSEAALSSVSASDQGVSSLSASEALLASISTGE